MIEKKPFLLGGMVFLTMTLGVVSVISGLILITMHRNFPPNQPKIMTALDVLFGLILAIQAWGVNSGKGFYRKYLVGLLLVILVEQLVKAVYAFLNPGALFEYTLSLGASFAFFILILIYFTRNEVKQYLEQGRGLV